MARIALVAALLAAVAALLAPAASAAQPPPAKPAISWTAAQLPAHAALPLAGLVRSAANGARSWKAAGNCTLRSSTLTVGASGTCTVTVTIAGTSKTAKGTSTTKFPITQVAVTTAATTTATTAVARRSVGKSEGSLTTPDGRIRTYTLYVPQTLPANTPVPLLIGLHGHGGWGTNFETISGFDALANQVGFITVYPDGYTPPGPRNQSWNGGYCCAAAVAQNIDDVAFIRQLITALVAPQQIDAKRIYVAGHSNGAIFGYRLGCELSDLVTAVGVQSGSLGVSPCKPARPVPLLHIHGAADQQTPIGGGKGFHVAWLGGGVNQRSALASVQEYAAAIGATSAPSTKVRPSNGDVSSSTWTGGSPLAVVEYIVVTGATHAWMGHPQAASQDAIIGKPYDKLDSTLEIWSFVSRFSR